MSLVPDPWWLPAVLAAALLFDAVASIRPPAFIRDCLDGVGFPRDWWWALIVIKTLAVVGLIVWGFFQGGAERGVDSIAIWVGVTGVLGALGAAAALPHPLTVLSAFLAAPVTTLHPAIAAGWVAGLVEAWLRPPSVGDFEALPEALESFRGFVRNPVVRILLVVVTTNIGSSLGTFVAIPWIAAR